MGSDSHERVLILGGGLTGLVLARRLADQGKDYLVIEARDRFGGRVLSQDVGLARVEMGAVWFLPKYKNLFRLLRDLKVELCEQYEVGKIVTEGEVKVEDEDKFRIRGGTQEIIEQLVNCLHPERLLLDHQVVEIRLEGRMVEVVTSDDKVILGTTVVSTLPPCLLSGLAFRPPLPRDVLGVAKRTPTYQGNVVRVVITYQVPFWRMSRLSGRLISSRGPIGELSDQTGEDGVGAALVGVLLEREDKEGDRMERVLEQLVRLFGKQAEEYLEYKELDWGSEVYTTHVDVGQGKEFRGHSLYQAPLWGGRLLLGGSETSPVLGGQMEGAVSSAIHCHRLLTASRSNK